MHIALCDRIFGPLSDMLTTILFSLLLSRDTCVFRPVDRDSLVPKVEYFQSQYDEFKKNGYSDFQLIYITNTSLAYVNVRGKELLIRREGKNKSSIQTSTTTAKPAVLEKFKKVMPGYYLSSCKNSGQPTYYYYVIKSKNRVIFSYNGYNKDIQGLEVAHDELTSVINLLKEVL